MTINWTTVILDGSMRGYATAVDVAMNTRRNLMLIVDSNSQQDDPRRWFCQHIRDSDRCSVVWELRERVDDVGQWETPYPKLRHADTAVSILEKYIPNLDPEEFDISELWKPHECALYGDNAWKFWTEVLCSCDACEECMVRNLNTTDSDLLLMNITR